MEATPIMEGVTMIILAQGMGMGMEQATIRTVPTQPHPPREIKVTLLALSAGRLDTMPRSALKRIMEMAMGALGRSPIHSTKDK